MKKLITFLLVFCLLTGCSMTNDLMNTPTKKVETLLNNYITLDEEVLKDLDNILLKETIMTTEQKDRYREILKKQYQNLSYEIKDETIDGNNATVEVLIEVYDYRKVIEDANAYFNSNNQEFITDENQTDTKKYNDYKLEQLEKAKEKISYTLNLTLSKNNDQWILDDLTDTEINKIHGLYA